MIDRPCRICPHRGSFALMSIETQTRPDYLTVRELADLLRIKERKVYDLAASGQVPCVRVTGKLLFPAAAIRDWIASGQSAGRPRARPAVFLGSHDPLLAWAIRQSRSGLATLFDGSVDGLARFRAGEGVATGLHIHDPDTGGWNVPAVEADCAGENVVLVAWAVRRRGLVIREGDAGSIGGLADLPGRTVVPRQPGSGAQRLFEHELAAAGIERETLAWSPVAHSENDSVLAVAQGAADAAFGLEALARPYGLHFVALVEERFDLLVDRRAWFEPPMQRLLSFCATPEFRDHAETLAGYDLGEHKEIRWNA
jgi:excisionase family DNA binding protein